MDDLDLKDPARTTVLSVLPNPEAKKLAESELPPLQKAIAIMRFLRSPSGCHWDREQSFDSIKRHTLEEVYEVFDAIERRSWHELRDELGDLLLQVLFYAQMAEEAGYFDITKVAEALNAKLVRRHPHVFGDVTASGSDEVVRNWDLIKQREKRASGRNKEILQDVPRSMPALLESSKLGSLAAKVGFDWPSADGLLEKMTEELEELRVEMQCGGKDRARLEEELGDVLFTTVNLARHLNLDAELALRSANAKFRRRFSVMEEEAGGLDGGAALTGEEWNRLWLRAKARETPTL